MQTPQTIVPLVESKTSGLTIFFGKVYGLLSLTLLTSALAALWVVKMHPAFVFNHYIALSLVDLGLVLVCMRVREIPVANLASLFAFTTLDGILFGPIISNTIKKSWGPEAVLEALGTTAVVFVGLSAYALISKRNFSFMEGFLFTGLLVLLVAILVEYVWSPAIYIEVVSSLAVLLFAGYMIYDTSSAKNNWQETNPVELVLSLYLDIANMLINLLRLFSKD